MKKNLTLFLLLLLLINASCKKTGDSSNNVLLQQYFEANVLNRNFIVSLATDNGNDLTANYNGYVFLLLKDDYFHGPLQVSKGSTVYTGSWSCNDDYGKLTIVLPDSPAEFKFLTRQWRFTSKNLPTLELAPWGSTQAVVLHMHRQ